MATGPNRHGLGLRRVCQWQAGPGPTHCRWANKGMTCWANLGMLNNPKLGWPAKKIYIFFTNFKKIKFFKIYKNLKKKNLKLENLTKLIQFSSINYTNFSNNSIEYRVDKFYCTIELYKHII